MVVKKLAENGGCLVKFYRRQIEKAKLRRQKQKEDNDFVSLYLKELDSVGADSRIQEDWLIQVYITNSNDLLDHFTFGTSYS